MPRCCWALCDAEREHSAQRWSRALKLEMPLKCMDKEHSKKLTRGFSPQLPKKTNCMSMKEVLRVSCVTLVARTEKIYFYINCWFTILPKFCNCFFLIKQDLTEGLSPVFPLNLNQYVSCAVCKGNSRGPVFSALRASGLVHHVR